MMSNGPVLVAAVVPQRLRARSSAASTSSGASSTIDVAEALALAGRAASGAAAARCWRMTCGPKSRSARPRLRSWQSCSGRSSTIATGRQWYSRASSTSGLRASGCTLVASTTVSRPRGQPLAGDEVQHLEGVVVAAWSFSSSRDQPRQ